MDYGTEIRRLRKERGVSQSKLAELLEISQPQLSRWELGKEEMEEGTFQEISSFLKSLDDGFIQELNKKRTRGGHSPRRSPKRGDRDDDLANQISAVPSIPRKPEQPIAIALFAGGGGLSVGFQQAGFHVAGYVEINDAFRKIYNLNFPDTPCLGHDVRELDTESLKMWRRELGEVDVLFGGPPCQGYSLAGKRNEDDPRNRLHREFARIAGVLQPKAVILENVKLLTSMKTPEGRPATQDILQAFGDAGYQMAFEELNAQDYGVPQFRERVFFIGVREDLASGDIPFPKRTHGPPSLFEPELESYRTFRDATEDLESLEAGEESDEDPWHFAVNHPEHVVEWLEDVPEGESAHENPDPENRPPSGYNTTYKRMVWDEPASTVGTTFAMISASRTVHPTDTRSMTIREALRCQTFPDDFELVGRLTDIRKAIGNAVPPRLARVVARCVRRDYLDRPVEEKASPGAY